MIRTPEFIKWIKIRIGQPLTALDMNERVVIFGSISGYIGFYLFGSNSLKYIDNTFQELIRAIYIEKGRAFGVIGDRQGIIFDYENLRYELKKIQRNHNNTICSYSMAFLYRDMQVIFCAYPTQKREVIQNQLNHEKSTLYQINLSRGEIAQHKDFNIPQVSVPFDFDGRRVLWLEYKEHGLKEFQLYDLDRRQVFPIVQFLKNFEFISHGRLFHHQLIFVQNNKNVKTYDMTRKLLVDLYHHTSSIIAFDIIRRQDHYELYSVDYNGILFIYSSKQAQTRMVSLLDIPGTPPEILKHRYIFDMGYPYYVKVFKDIVAVTSDLGLLLFRI